MNTESKTTIKLGSRVSLNESSSSPSLGGDTGYTGNSLGSSLWHQAIAILTNQLFREGKMWETALLLCVYDDVTSNNLLMSFNPFELLSFFSRQQRKLAIFGCLVFVAYSVCICRYPSHCPLWVWWLAKNYSSSPLINWRSESPI